MLKQSLVGSSLGRLAVRARARLELLSAPLEQLGTIANDQLAEKIVTRLCSQGGRFLDIGAHIGSIIASVQHHCPGVHIVAVEAIPDKVERLRSKFPKVDVHCCALSDHEGEASFYINTEHSGYSSLCRSGNSREIRVSLRTLDSLLPTALFDIIKIDVEGAEEGVIRGGERLIERCRPVIMFESGPSDVLGFTKEGLWRWFHDRSYGIFAPNRVAHETPPMTLDAFADSHFYPRRTTNFFASPLEKVSSVRERARSIL